MKTKQKSVTIVVAVILLALLCTSVLPVLSFAESNDAAWGDVSISLNENFDLNFYADAVPDGAVVSFRDADGNILADNITPEFKNGKAVYTYKGITPQFLEREIAAVMTAAETVVAEKKASVKAYCDALIAQKPNSKAAAVAGQILAYGKAAEWYVSEDGAKPEGLTDLAASDVNLLYPGKITAGTAIRAAQLILGHDIRVAFLLKDTTATGNATVTVGNNTYNVAVEGGRITVALKASELFEKITASFDDCTVEYSLAQYVKNKLGGDNEKLSALVSEIYRYALAVHFYAGEHSYEYVLENKALTKVCRIGKETAETFSRYENASFDFENGTSPIGTVIDLDGNKVLQMGGDTNRWRLEGVHDAADGQQVHRGMAFSFRIQLSYTDGDTVHTTEDFEIYGKVDNGWDKGFMSTHLTTAGGKINLHGLETNMDIEADKWYTITYILYDDASSVIAMVTNEAGTTFVGNVPAQNSMKGATVFNFWTLEETAKNNFRLDDIQEFYFDVPHNRSDEWSSDDAQHWHACTDEDCNEKLDLADHTWKLTETTESATCTDEGHGIYTCDVCGKTKEDAIAPTGEHIYQYVVENKSLKKICRVGGEAAEVFTRYENASFDFEDGNAPVGTVIDLGGNKVLQMGDGNYRWRLEGVHDAADGQQVHRGMAFSFRIQLSYTDGDTVYTTEDFEIYGKVDNGWDKGFMSTHLTTAGGKINLHGLETDMDIEADKWYTITYILYDDASSVIAMVTNEAGTTFVGNVPAQNSMKGATVFNFWTLEETAKNNFRLDDIQEFYFD